MFRIYKTEGKSYLVFGEVRLKCRLLSKAKNRWDYVYQVETFLYHHSGKAVEISWRDCAEMEKRIMEKSYAFSTICYYFFEVQKFIEYTFSDPEKKECDTLCKAKKARSKKILPLKEL